MSLSERRTAFSFSALATLGVAPALALVAAIAGAPGQAVASQAPACDKERSAVTSTMSGVPRSIAGSFDRRLDKASALSRLHRPEDALAQLDALLALLEGPRGALLQEKTQTELTKATHAVRRCLAQAQPAPLEPVTIRVFEEGGDAAGAGVYLDMEGVPVGRTGRDGTLQADLPLGAAIVIRATQYPSSVGEAEMVRSGIPPVVSVVMADGKEPSEDSDLVLEEAGDGILPANSTSLVLKFVQDEGPVAIESIDQLDVADDAGSSGDDLKEHFRVVGGTMHATDLAAVHRRIAGRARIGRPLWLTVSGIDAEGRTHYGAIPFLLGQFRLAAVLAPPPSNPALPVSHIPVRISVMGTDVVLTRTADAAGRFAVEALPDATVLFEAHTVASGVHYYADAPLTLCADRSVTLVMRHVEDLVAGVPGLRLHPGAPCPDVPRR